MNEKYLTKIGMRGDMINQAGQFSGLHPARVTSVGRDICRIWTGEDEGFARVSGSLRNAAATPTELPAVGDFVLVDRPDTRGGDAVIHHILPRRSLFLRRAAGTSGSGQLIAANIDTVMLCMAMNQDFNLRRLERYLAAAWESGASPVVVLTKPDLCENPQALVREAEAVALGVPAVCVNNHSDSAAAALAEWTGAGQTCAFVGSSGVGKSTLINRLLGDEKLETGAIRSDGKGRHTTTSRELLILPSGGFVIDTPGMRAFALESGELSKTFADIDTLAASCRFADCTHETEPGCAVLQAVADGTLVPERLKSYRKIQKELGYEGLNARQIEEKKITDMFAGFGGMKNARKYIQEKTRQKGR